MISKTIPPEDERVSDDVLQQMIYSARGRNDLFTMRALTELQSLRSTQPDREAIIEECVSEVDRMKQNKDRAFTRFAEKIADAIRSLKHSDTTPDGGENG